MELRFLKSGVRIEPYTLTSRSEQYRYEKLDVTVSRQAARYISDNAVKFEPVELLIDEEVQGRYFYPASGISISGDTAEVTIFDALKITSRGSISKRYGTVTLADVVEFVYGKIEDPYGVITDYRFVDEVEVEQITQDYLDQFWFTNNRNYSLGPYDRRRTYNDGIGAFLSLIGEKEENNQGGFNFKEVSPAKAISDIESEFGLDTWVEDDGTLVFGPRSAAAKTNLVLDTTNVFDEYKMKSYDVYFPGEPVETVIVRGTPDALRSSGKEIFASVSPIAKLDKLQVIAKATAPNVDGTVHSINTPVTAKEPVAVENAAARKLANIYAEQEAGSITFNSQASENTEDLVNLTVGSRIAAMPGITDMCQKQSDGGLYMTTAVNHSVSQESGWETSIEIAAIPPEIETSSYIYDLTNSEQYPDLQSYKDTLSGDELELQSSS